MSSKSFFCPFNVLSCCSFQPVNWPKIEGLFLGSFCFCCCWWLWWSKMIRMMMNQCFLLALFAFVHSLGLFFHLVDSLSFCVYLLLFYIYLLYKTCKMKRRWKIFFFCPQGFQFLSSSAFLSCCCCCCCFYASPSSYFSFWEVKKLFTKKCCVQLEIVNIWLLHMKKSFFLHFFAVVFIVDNNFMIIFTNCLKSFQLNPCEQKLSTCKQQQ